MGMTGLFTEAGECVAHWSAGDLHQPLERLVQLQDEEDRTRNRQRTGEQHRDDGGVVRREQAEGGEDDRKPENQHQQKWRGERVAPLLEQEKARFSQIGADLQRLGMQRALDVVLRL